MNVRPVEEIDLPALAGLAAADEAAMLGRPSRLGVADVRAWLARVDLARDSWLFEEGGAPVGFGWFAPWGPLGAFAGVVGPSGKGRGIGAEIVERGEATARAGGFPRLQTWTLAPDERARELLEGRGYAEVRRFYEMAIELREEPPRPSLPDGFRIAPFAPPDARAFHAALDEAFADHWEHHSTPFEQWWEEKRTAHDYDPTLWFLVRDGDEIAATVRNDPERSGGGYVAALGVRRDWRGRGLAKALLLHTFAEFRRRGQRRVTLGVDAENTTGATRLYERAGMRVEQEMVVFEKGLT